MWFWLVTVSAQNYQPFRVSVLELNQNCAFGRTLGAWHEWHYHDILQIETSNLENHQHT